MAAIQEVLQAQAAIEGELLAKHNVIGVAVGYKESGGVVSDELALVALVPSKKPVAQLASNDLIPKNVEGIVTDVYEVGDLRAQNTHAKARFRPTIPAGVSVGHQAVTAGTFGAVVRDRNTQERLLLSNNHVLANNNAAAVGDAILQPGIMDGGQHPSDKVATLERFIPLRFIEDATEGAGPTPIPTDPNAPGCVGFFVALTNLIASLTGSQQRVAVSSGPQSVEIIPEGRRSRAQSLTPDNALDAALARPLDPAMFEDVIRHIGVVSGTNAPALGMTIRKSGRTTELTQGSVTLLNATINITYETQRGARTARFTGQVLSDPISQGGDSGSLVVDAQNRAVGLLFAGSTVASVFTPIDTVLAALNITI